MTRIGGDVLSGDVEVVHIEAPDGTAATVVESGGAVTVTLPSIESFSESGGTASFFGATPVVRQNLPASPTAQQIVDAAVALGLFTQGSSVTTGTTISGGVLESEIVTGGQTIILTLTGATWAASGATFNAQRQAIINGITAAEAEAAGWNAAVKAAMVVTNVVRTSDTVVTVTLPAVASYQITANENVTVTIPAAALADVYEAVVSTTNVVVTHGS